MITKNDRRYCVYMLRFSATGEPFYVGRGLKNRPKQHFTPSSLKVESPKNFIINNFDTYCTVERDCLTNDEANAYEKELIALWGFENLANKTRGGSGLEGYRHSAETRAKQSEVRIGKYCGENHYMFGKSLSAETRAKISKANRGKKASAEARAKRSGANSGNKHPNYDATLYNFRHKDGPTETCTQYELRMKYNLSQGHLSNVVNGKRKSVGDGN